MPPRYSPADYDIPWPYYFGEALEDIGQNLPGIFQRQEALYQQKELANAENQRQMLQALMQQYEREAARQQRAQEFEETKRQRGEEFKERQEFQRGVQESLGEFRTQQLAGQQEQRALKQQELQQKLDEALQKQQGEARKQGVLSSLFAPREPQDTGEGPAIPGNIPGLQEFLGRLPAAYEAGIEPNVIESIKKTLYPQAPEGARPTTHFGPRGEIVQVQGENVRTLREPTPEEVKPPKPFAEGKSPAELQIIIDDPRSAPEDRAVATSALAKIREAELTQARAYAAGRAQEQQAVDLRAPVGVRADEFADINGQKPPADMPLGEVVQKFSAINAKERDTLPALVTIEQAFSPENVKQMLTLFPSPIARINQLNIRRLKEGFGPESDQEGALAKFIRIEALATLLARLSGETGNVATADTARALKGLASAGTAAQFRGVVRELLIQVKLNRRTILQTAPRSESAPAPGLPGPLAPLGGGGGLTPRQQRIQELRQQLGR